MQGHAVDVVLENVIVPLHFIDQGIRLVVFRVLAESIRLVIDHVVTTFMTEDQVNETSQISRERIKTQPRDTRRILKNDLRVGMASKNIGQALRGQSGEGVRSDRHREFHFIDPRVPRDIPQRDRLQLATQGRRKSLLQSDGERDRKAPRHSSTR